MAALVDPASPEQATPNRIRVLIADNYGVLRACLSALLSAEPGLEVVGEVVTGEAALAMASELCADVVLMDISMPGLGGIELIRRIASQGNLARVLVLTGYEDRRLLREAIRAGASGYILRRADKAELIQAIQAVARGERYIQPAVSYALFAETTTPIAGRKAGAGSLSLREVRILRLVARGYTNRQVAEELKISLRTVECHRANLMGKLQLHSRAELVRFAIQNGMFGEEGMT